MLAYHFVIMVHNSIGKLAAVSLCDSLNIILELRIPPVVTLQVLKKLFFGVIKGNVESDLVVESVFSFNKISFSRHGIHKGIESFINIAELLHKALSANSVNGGRVADGKDFILGIKSRYS